MSNHLASHLKNLSNIIQHDALIGRFCPVGISINANGKKIPDFDDGWTTNTYDTWNNRNSVAIRTGKGLTVLDFDTKDLTLLDSWASEFLSERLEKKDCLMMKTTKGYHIYLDTTGEEFKNDVRLAPFLDIRSEGGCVFASTTVKGLRYEVYCLGELYKADKELLGRLKTAIKGNEYSYNEEGVKVSTTLREPNPALFNAVSSGDIKRIIKACRMSAEDFTKGQMYVKFNNFAFIIANEPSIHNEDVLTIVEMLVTNVMGFKWDSPTTKKMVAQSLGNMIYAAEYIEPPIMQIFALENKFCVLHNGKLTIGLTNQTARLHWIKAKNDKDEFIGAINIIHAIEYKVDFFKPTEFNYIDDTLYVTTNPIDSWDILKYEDMEIIEEYENKIMGSNLKDLVNLIVWSMRFNENKLNKLLLVGVSDKGKTGLMKLMGFVEISAKTFTNILKGEKQGDELSKRIKMCGLILADDINEIPLEIKNVSDELHMTVLYEGTINHPCKFMCFTSTHKSSIDTISEELKNRILVMDLENEFTLRHSTLCQSNSQKYRQYTENYVKGLIIDAIEAEVDEAMLRELQEKYRAPEHNARDEIIEIIEERIGREVNELLKDADSEVILVKGKLYALHKKEIIKIVRRAIELEFDGMVVDKQKECSKLMDKFASDKPMFPHRKDGQKRNYYELHIAQSSFQADFEDLDDL